MKAKLILALKRAAWTVAEVFVALCGTDLVSITELNWPRILGICATAGVLSIAKSIIAGMPEHEDTKIYIPHEGDV